jgi:polyferredoxin
MECVACTACIDACDDVMTKLKRPTGLIRYDSELGLKKQATSLLRPRIFVYVAFLALVVSVLTYILSQRKDVDAAWIRAIDTPYQQVTGPSGAALVINHYRVDISNKSFDDIPVNLTLPDDQKALGFELITQTNPTIIEAGKNRRVDLFIRFPRERLKFGKTTTKVLMQGQSENNRSSVNSHEELTLVGPY